MADPDTDVRRRAAGNGSCPPDVLSGLGEDSDRRVREAAARNPNTPQQALRRLGRDPDDDVRDTAARNLNVSTGRARTAAAYSTVDACTTRPPYCPSAGVARRASQSASHRRADRRDSGLSPVDSPQTSAQQRDGVAAGQQLGSAGLRRRRRRSAAGVDAAVPRQRRP